MVYPTRPKKAHGGTDYIYNGIDRIDNERGYLPDNAVPCCKRCNQAKADMAIDEFKGWLSDIMKHFYTGKQDAVPQQAGS
jgi:5-methylcytosine-specific restriction endonuclease McrA